MLQTPARYQPTAIAVRHGFATSLLKALRYSVEAAAAWTSTALASHHARSRLRGLSDHHLKDIGLSRSEIDPVVPDFIIRDAIDTWRDRRL